MKLQWKSPFQTHAYEPLYLANGTFGGMLDLSGSTLDLWSAETGARSQTEGSDERLWPVTSLRLQAYYRNRFWREVDFWIGRTGILCDDPSYLSNPSMPHLPQVYQCNQTLDLDAGLATTKGVLYPGSQAALEAGLATERAIPFSTRVAFLKGSTLMGIEIVADAETDILIYPETILHETFSIRNTGKGISTLGNAMECDLELKQTLISSEATQDRIRYCIQLDGDEPYTVSIHCPGASIEQLKDSPPGLMARERIFCLVEILPAGKSAVLNPPILAEDFFKEQARRWSEFWEQSEVILPDSEPLWQERYRTSLFYVAQSMTDGAAQPVGMSKPMLPYWHGCFHDTDTYFARPLLETGHFPEARRHLGFRHRTLDAANKAATQYDRSGALYPWQSDPKGNGEIIDVPINNAIIAVEAWHHYLHSRNPEDRDRATDILTEVFCNLLDIVDLSASPLMLKPEPLMTFSEVMTAQDPTEVRLAIRAVAKALIQSGCTNAELLNKAGRIFSELPLPIEEDGSYAFSQKQDPLYSRVSSITLGSFPLHILPADEALLASYKREISRQVFLFAWIPYQIAVVASQLQIKEGPTAAVALMRQADSFFKGPWHAFDEWENRRTARAGIFVTSAGGFCTALHHLLLAETAPGVWALWPGVPENWKDLSFSNLHTRAGWVISAKREKGQTVEVEARPVNDRADATFTLITDPATGKTTTFQVPL